MKLVMLLLLLVGACTTTRAYMLPDNAATVNMAYGEVYHHNESGTPFSIPSSGVYYNLTFMLDGDLQRFTTQNGALVVPTSGVYALEWHLSFDGGGGKEHEITVIKENTEQVDCEGYRKLGSQGDVGNAGGTCLLSVNAGEIVSLAVESVTNPPADIGIYTANLNMVRVS